MPPPDSARPPVMMLRVMVTSPMLWMFPPKNPFPTAEPARPLAIVTSVIETITSKKAPFTSNTRSTPSPFTSVSCWMIVVRAPAPTMFTSPVVIERAPSGPLSW